MNPDFPLGAPAVLFGYRRRMGTPVGAWLRNGVLCLVCMGCPWASAQTVPLGTLLYTPQQRAAMAQTRSDGASGGGASGDGAVALAVPARQTRLNGVVARVRQQGTAWINDEPVLQGSNARTRLRGTEAVVDGHRLRVGESIDHASGLRSDLVAPDAIRRRRVP